MVPAPQEGVHVTGQHLFGQLCQSFPPCTNSKMKSKLSCYEAEAVLVAACGATGSWDQHRRGNLSEPCKSTIEFLTAMAWKHVKKETKGECLIPTFTLILSWLLTFTSPAVQWNRHDAITDCLKQTEPAVKFIPPDSLSLSPTTNYSFSSPAKSQSPSTHSSMADTIGKGCIYSILV